MVDGSVVAVLAATTIVVVVELAVAGQVMIAVVGKIAFEMAGMETVAMGATALEMEMAVGTLADALTVVVGRPDELGIVGGGSN